jgi:hypothetical protein
MLGEQYRTRWEKTISNAQYMLPLRWTLPRDDVFGH